MKKRRLSRGQRSLNDEARHYLRHPEAINIRPSVAGDSMPRQVNVAIEDWIERGKFEKL
jgi:hypothetical protein